MTAVTLRGWFGGLVCVAAFAGLARAEDAKAPASDPAARALFDEVVKAYRKLDAYSDHGEFALSMKIDGRSEKQSTPLHFSFARPNKVNLNVGPVRLVSDGKTLVTAVTPFKKFVSSPAPKSLSIETFREGPAGAMLFGGPTTPVMQVLIDLLVGEEPASSILKELGGTLKLDPDHENRQVLRVERPNADDIRLMIDKATKLLHAIELEVDAKALSETLGQKVTVEQAGWVAGAISTDAPKAEAFTYDPPKAFTKVESFVDAVAAEGPGQSKYRVDDLIGKPAPDFTLSVLDDAGKFKLVTKADLAGKVVMIDFWATWCGPCLKELPDVQKLVEGYAKDKKNVVVVALSLDERPSEIRDVRKLVEAKLDQIQIKLTGNSVGMIALDPSGATRDAFQVEVLPTVVILDQKGIVQSTHIGLNPEAREILAKDIETLLQGKSLVNQKRGGAEK